MYFYVTTYIRNQVTSKTEGLAKILFYKSFNYFRFQRFL